jgi:hypothetical protein
MQGGDAAADGTATLRRGAVPWLLLHKLKFVIIMELAPLSSLTFRITKPNVPPHPTPLLPASQSTLGRKGGRKEGRREAAAGPESSECQSVQGGRMAGRAEGREGGRQGGRRSEGARQGGRGEEGGLKGGDGGLDWAARWSPSLLSLSVFSRLLQPAIISRPTWVLGSCFACCSSLFCTFLW